MNTEQTSENIFTLHSRCLVARPKRVITDFERESTSLSELIRQGTDLKGTPYL